LLFAATPAALHVKGVFAAEAASETVIGNATTAAGRLASRALAALLCLDTIALIALGLIAILIPCAILILPIAILLSAIAILTLPVAILLLCTIAILILTVLLLCAITILLLRAIAILTVPVLLWTVAVSIGLILFPWFFFSWFFLRRWFRLVLLILALHRECEAAEKQRQSRGCYQQLHECSLQNLHFT